MTKKKITPERLIAWAYKDELPKAQTSSSFLRPEGFGFGWGSVGRYGKYLADPQEPDIRNRFGVVPDLTSTSQPHPDAIAVWIAVHELEALQFDLPDDWDPISDLGDLGPEGRAAVVRAIDRLSVRGHNGERYLRLSLPQVVQRCAILGAPDWRAEKPERKLVSHTNGKPKWFMRTTIETKTGPLEIEVDGFDNKARRPHYGAYQKTFLDPDPADAAEARGEYQLWHWSVEFVGERLAGRLEDHEVAASELTGYPWEEGDRPAQCILVDPRPPQPIIREPRPITGPPPKRGIERKSTGDENEKPVAT